VTKRTTSGTTDAALSRLASLDAGERPGSLGARFRNVFQFSWRLLSNASYDLLLLSGNRCVAPLRMHVIHVSIYLIDPRDLLRVFSRWLASGYLTACCQQRLAEWE